MNAAALARQLKVPTKRRQGFAPDHFFGNSAEFSLNLQSLYELRLAKKKAGKSIKQGSIQ